MSGEKEEWHLPFIQIFYYMLAKLACCIKINILFPIFIFYNILFIYYAWLAEILDFLTYSAPYISNGAVSLKFCHGH